jgi:transposase
MITNNGNLHLEIQTSRKNPVGILRSSFYENGKTRHNQYGRITGCTINQLKLIQQAFRQSVIPVDAPEAFQIVQSKEFGASFSILQVIKKAGLDKIIYSKKQPWVNAVLAMTIGRIIYAGSKLSLCNMQDNTNLWKLCGIKEKIDVEKHCYLPMDCLLERQMHIQKKLAKKHLSNNCLVLYDITSSYLEGEYNNSKLVNFGYNRDSKKGHEQIVIGLLCNKEGCPIGVEVFKGNTKDSTTVLGKIKEIQKLYGIEKVIFVGDRGMMTKNNLDALNKSNFCTITALTRADINKLIEHKVIQPELFDDNITEITDPQNHQRYCLCRNSTKAKKDQKTRDILLEKTKTALEKIANYKQSTTPEILGARVGKVLEKYGTAKYINWQVKADKLQKSNKHKVIWEINENTVRKDQQLAGCYVVASNVKEQDMNAIEIVESYKKLVNVEKAFSNLKTVQLEIRPIYHKKDDRIKAHVFLCMLAYYTQWHMQQKLTTLKNKDKGKNRQWTFSNIIETLKQITHNKIKAKGVEFYKISKPTPKQQKILNLLEVTI